METNTGEREDDVGVWKSVLGDRSKIFKDWKWTDDEARGEDIRSNQGNLGGKNYFFLFEGSRDGVESKSSIAAGTFKKGQQMSWSKSNPTSPLKLSQKNSSFNFKKIPDLKKKKSVQDSDEAMPNLSAKNSVEIDHEDTESIIITNQQLKKFESKKSSILKRGSNNNLVSRESDTSLKPMNDLPDGILNFDSETDQYTLEGDIEGLMSVSEPSTRVHTTHPSQHPTETENSEDEAVIDDFSVKKDQQEMDNEKQNPATDNNVKEEAENIKEDSHMNLVDNRNETDNNEKNGKDSVDDSQKTSSPSASPDLDNPNGTEHADEEINAFARDISDEESDEKNDEDEQSEKSESGPGDNGESQHCDNNSVAESMTKEGEKAPSDLEKNLTLEDDLHVSDAEDETPEPSHDVEEAEILSKVINDNPIRSNPADSKAITLHNFDSTIDKIVADVTTKSVIKKEKDDNTIDFSAFNWKPNVEFFSFGNTETENVQKSVNIFNFGKGTPPPPQIIKKKGVLSGERPRSKSLQRALAKRNGYY